MKFYQVADKRYKCTGCKKSILKDQRMVAVYFGKYKSKWHEECYKKDNQDTTIEKEIKP